MNIRITTKRCENINRQLSKYRHPMAYNENIIDILLVIIDIADYHGVADMGIKWS